jgi:hypothetical protein
VTKTTLLASIAALSLLVAPTIASAQSVNQGSPKGAESPGSAAPKGGSASQASPDSKPVQTQSNTPAAAGSKPGPTAEDRKGAPQQAQDKPASATQPKSATTPAADSKTTTTGAAASGGAGAAAAPPAEKRGQIATAIKQEKIPAVTNVNFNVSIGTRVPSTVRFHPIPSRIVEIYPQWRGYHVIYVNNRYVIVRPETYEIVYIIEA